MAEDSTAQAAKITREKPNTIGAKPLQYYETLVGIVLGR
jgi:hypothetical protein